ncbi:MAG: PTS glucose transporter subunit IIA [Erysipelotrichaceae bacterium]|nr:PTS glucose transporter subunit IIA [Erysipelotrichaceae bacterium]MBQ4254051.1 PTS glucose transporter subunit IIA [Erysipelotrichaceae bacterium]
MGLFDSLFHKKPVLEKFDVSDEAIVAIADGKLIDVTSVSDPVFAQQMMGKSTAFHFNGRTVLCSPANGTLSLIFPTGHAYGVTTNEGVEILIHCGVDTVNARGDGFRILSHKQGDKVSACDPIVEVDFDRLSQDYDMSTMLIITNANGKQIDFIEPQDVRRGDLLNR